MNINNYIESGIIERYLLGLATTEQEEELLYLRQLYPLLDVEMTTVALRIEGKLLEEAVHPPEELKDTVLRRIRPRNRQGKHHNNGYNTNEHQQNGPTYINLQPGWNRRISVSIWWRCAFIAVIVLSMSLAASTWYFYQRAAQLEEVLIRLKMPVPANPSPAHP
ncbi:hypothetical protein CLV51_101468 [Chitinophaga niastensis]|uniref:Uncharacterized protein n=1 Tax=Chitinophaga niastensis TaxID=536980 RepID=A0A2P8HSF6_CHINA|nr:hypothetical protein [Chitinophaga niastensis]PSL49138.1 hypothetical protein CLV51_101468 [Chitinophaga niastensis]